MYEEGNWNCTESCDGQRYSSYINVVRNTGYEIQIEILKNDLGKDDKKVTSIKVDGKDIGDCYPSVYDETCGFYDCSLHLKSKYIFSPTGVIHVEMYYSRHSQKCGCDIETFNCDRLNKKRPQIKTAAKITLTPNGNRKYSQKV